MTYLIWSKLFTENRHLGKKMPHGNKSIKKHSPSSCCSWVSCLSKASRSSVASFLRLNVGGDTSWPVEIKHFVTFISHTDHMLFSESYQQELNSSHSPWLLVTNELKLSASKEGDQKAPNAVVSIKFTNSILMLERVDFMAIIVINKFGYRR